MLAFLSIFIITNAIYLSLLLPTKFLDFAGLCFNIVVNPIPNHLLFKQDSGITAMHIKLRKVAFVLHLILGLLSFTYPCILEWQVIFVHFKVWQILLFLIIVVNVFALTTSGNYFLRNITFITINLFPFLIRLTSDKLHNLILSKKHDDDKERSPFHLHLGNRFDKVLTYYNTLGFTIFFGCLRNLAAFIRILLGFNIPLILLGYLCVNIFILYHLSSKSLCYNLESINIAMAELSKIIRPFIMSFFEFLGFNVKTHDDGIYTHHRFIWFSYEFVMGVGLITLKLMWNWDLSEFTFSLIKISSIEVSRYFKYLWDLYNNNQLDFYKFKTFYYNKFLSLISNYSHYYDKFITYYSEYKSQFFISYNKLTDLCKQDKKFTDYYFSLDELKYKKKK